MSTKAKRPRVILGIEHREERRTGVEERVLTYGPCSDCGDMAWLSEREGDLLCGACWYGPMWEGQDPILDDIMAHLRSTYREALADVEAEPGPQEYAVITPEVHEDVAEVYCPHCLEPAEQVIHGGQGAWRCKECLSGWMGYAEEAIQQAGGQHE